MPYVARPQEPHFDNRPELAVMLLGPSAAMGYLWRSVRSFAPHARAVLITGSPDAGQEAVAWLIHELSPGPCRPFLTLRGQEAEDRLSLPNSTTDFRPAARVFLPEVDRLSPAAQAGLLHLLRTRHHRTFSVVAGITEKYDALVGSGRLSADLAEVLSAVQIAMPSLKERSEDIPILLSQMLATRCQATNHPVPKLTKELLRAAMQHSWAGNFHELSGVVDNLLARAGNTQELRAADLRYPLRSTQVSKLTTEPLRLVKLNTVIKEHCLSVLLACRGNKFRTAEVLGISRSTLYRILDAENTSVSSVSEVDAAR